MVREVDDRIAHGFERALPTRKVAVRPTIIFALTFKARNSVNRVTGTDLVCPKFCFEQAKTAVPAGLSLKLLVSENP